MRVVVRVNMSSITKSPHQEFKLCPWIFDQVQQRDLAKLINSKSNNFTVKKQSVFRLHTSSKTWVVEAEGNLFFFCCLFTATAKSLQLCPTLCDPTDSSHQAPPSLGFSRQEYWSGLPFKCNFYFISGYSWLTMFGWFQVHMYETTIGWVSTICQVLC